MKIKFMDEVEPKETMKRVVLSTIETTQKELGLDKYEDEINFAFVDDLEKIVKSRFARGGTTQDLETGKVIVLIKPQDPLNVMLTIVHELVHVRQFLSKQLSDTHEGYAMWNNKRYDVSNLDKTSPWEEEAYRLMNYLFITAFGKLRSHDREWVIGSTYS